MAEPVALRYEEAVGGTLKAMRGNLSDELHRSGDCVLVWVNEGDLLNLSLNTRPAPDVADHLPTSNAVGVSETGNMSDKVAGLVDELSALHVWPQFVADYHAEVLLPRQSKGLYKVGDVATRAATALTTLSAENERLAQAWKIQHDEKVKEREEAKLWFDKAQEWKAENAALVAEVERLRDGKALPRLTEAMMRAACKAHYGSDNIDGIDLTASDRNWSFRQGFKRMWAGARQALGGRHG